MEEAILWTANHASFGQLDLEIGLDVRAATGIVEKRGFDDVDQVDAVPYVGKEALGRMAAFGKPFVIGEVHRDLGELASSAGAGDLVEFAGFEWARAFAYAGRARSMEWLSAEERAGLQRWKELRRTCSPGRVVSSGGVIYDGLDDALLKADGRGLQLCDGGYSLHATGGAPNLHLVGLGAERTVVHVTDYAGFGEVDLGALRLTGALSVRGFRLEATEIHLEGRIAANTTRRFDVRNSVVTGTLVGTSDGTVVGTEFIDGGFLQLELDQAAVEVMNCDFVNADTGIVFWSQSTGPFLEDYVLVEDSSFSNNSRGLELELWTSGMMEFINARFNTNEEDIMDHGGPTSDPRSWGGLDVVNGTCEAGYGCDL